MSERVPEGWTKFKLGDVGIFSTSSVDKKVNDGETPVSLLNYMDIYRNSVLSSAYPFQSVTAPQQQISSSSVQNGDIFFTPSSETPDDIGHSAVFIGELERLVHSYHTIRFRLKTNKHLDDNYKAYAFKGEKTYEYFRKRATGSTRFTVSLPIFNDLEVILPPLPEQKKIASIFTSVDEVIENTQKQIDKLQDLKKATMNELLTKGTGHTEFKDSEVGRIPKSWGLVKLGDTGEWKGGGTPSKSNPEFWEGNIPWVSPKDMKYEHISQTEDYVSERAVANSSTNLIDAGAILIVVRSGILKHTLPVAISKCKLTVNQDMKALSVSKNFSNLFIYHYLVAKNHLVLRSTLKAGNTVESIDAQVFSEYLIPSPPRQEQIEIANVIESIASQIRKKKRKLAQTQSLKKSLMQDLLTGKVRVQVN